MRIILFLISFTFLSITCKLFAHGVPHQSRSEERSALAEAVDVQSTGVPVNLKSNDRNWEVEATTGWDSRHVHYGVDESGPSGNYVNEVSVQVGNFSFNAWNGFGLGNDLVEWDFTGAYNLALGPVFLMPGYNFRYVPSQNEDGHDHGHEAEHADGHHEGHADEHSGGHSHNLYSNEVFLTLGTTAIPYVTPSTVFVWDLNNTPGVFLECRLDGDVPVYKDVVSLQPYALLGLNFGYNTNDAYGLNNFQFGLQTTCRLWRYISAFAGINYSVALEALQTIGQENVVWVNVGLTFAY